MRGMGIRMDRDFDKRIKSIKKSPKTKCIFGDENDRDGYTYDIKDIDLAWLFNMILWQRSLLEKHIKDVKAIGDPVVVSLSKIKDINVLEDGMWIKNEEDDAVFIGWDSMDKIIDASEEHYYNDIIKDFMAMVSQKNIN